MAKLVTIPVITLKQPWAYLLAKGFKLNETRSFNTHFRGELYIHASLKIDFNDLELINQDKHFKVCIPDRSLLVQGAIIGKFTVLNSEPTERFTTDYLEAINPASNKRYLNAQERAFGDYRPGRFAWIGANHRELAQPVPARGMLGIWKYEVDEELLGMGGAA